MYIIQGQCELPVRVSSNDAPVITTSYLLLLHRILEVFIFHYIFKNQIHGSIFYEKIPHLHFSSNGWGKQTTKSQNK